jgi:hypothetical protein
LRARAFLRFFADGRTALLVPNTLVKNLPNEPTEPVGDGSDGLRVPEARDESSIRDREDRTLGCDPKAVRGSKPKFDL